MRQPFTVDPVKTLRCRLGEPDDIIDQHSELGSLVVNGTLGDAARETTVNGL